MWGSAGIAEQVSALRGRVDAAHEHAEIAEARGEEAVANAEDQAAWGVERAQNDASQLERQIGTTTHQQGLASRLLNERSDFYRIRYELLQLAIDFQEFGGKNEAETRFRRTVEEGLSSIGSSFSRLSSAILGEMGGRVYAQKFEPRQLWNSGADHPVDFTSLEQAWEQVQEAKDRLEQLEIQLGETYDRLAHAKRSIDITTEEGRSKAKEAELNFRSQVEGILANAADLAGQADGLEAGLTHIPSP